jgi:hypothetical protein
MSAAQMDVAWDSRKVLESLPISFASATEIVLARQIAPAGRSAARCPECHSVIYSRRHRLCGVCSHPLPEHLLFTANESIRIEQLLRDERQRHRLWMEQRRAH